MRGPTINKTESFIEKTKHLQIFLICDRNKQFKKHKICLQSAVFKRKDVQHLIRQALSSTVKSIRKIGRTMTVRGITKLPVNNRGRSLKTKTCSVRNKLTRRYKAKEGSNANTGLLYNKGKIYFEINEKQGHYFLQDSNNELEYDFRTRMKPMVAPRIRNIDSYDDDLKEWKPLPKRKINTQAVKSKPTESTTKRTIVRGSYGEVDLDKMIAEDKKNNFRPYTIPKKVVKKQPLQQSVFKTVPKAPSLFQRTMGYILGEEVESEDDKVERWQWEDRMKHTTAYGEYMPRASREYIVIKSMLWLGPESKDYRKYEDELKEIDKVKLKNRKKK